MCTFLLIVMFKIGLVYNEPWNNPMNWCCSKQYNYWIFRRQEMVNLHAPKVLYPEESSEILCTYIIPQRKFQRIFYICIPIYFGNETFYKIQENIYNYPKYSWFTYEWSHKQPTTTSTTVGIVGTVGTIYKDIESEGFNHCLCFYWTSLYCFNIGKMKMSNNVSFILKLMHCTYNTYSHNRKYAFISINWFLLNFKL